MDVKTGHCWRCAKPLPQHSVKCSMCPLAEYCSRDCLQQDRVRHGSVDCRVFGTKRCKQCGKQDKLKECAACSNAWYCNAACQQQHWPIHKIDCKQITEYIKATGPRMGKWHSDIGGELHKTDDPPAYIGNTIAVDFLQLEGNEWSELVAVGEEELKRDYCVLSAGCGDLRSTLLTVASLPARYQGTLHVTLDDFDPFVMARNVMFLVMMVRLAARDGIASSLATIWYSVHLSRGDYNLIKETLEELTGTDAGGLSTLTLGLVSVQEADFRYLRQVWEGWLVLQCQRRARASINLHQQRKRIFDKDSGAKIGLPKYLNRMPQADANFMRQWFKHGLFLPNSADPGNLPFDNPTLTGRPSTKYEYKQTLNPDMKSPRDYPFVYNVNTDSTPFIVWDCLRVAEFTGQCHLNVMERYHAYVTHILQQSINIIKEKRLQVGIFLANCLDFPNYHLTLSMPKYDRIFTSNLQDLIGLSRILTTFKPLLNTDNKQSMIITQTLNWIMHTPGADVQNVPRVEIFRILGMCREDTGLSHKLSEDVNNHREYYNNTHWFLAYLRADIMGGGIGIPAMDHVPKLSEVTHFNGMRMRNFRKGLNKLVPFKYRVNARKITMLNGMDRNVEWCLPDNGK